MKSKPKSPIVFLGLCVALLGALSSLDLARAQEGTASQLRPGAARAFSAASVKAAPNQRCRLHAGRSPSEGIPVFTDGDGYARFFAVRPGPESAPEATTLTCTDPAGRVVSYPVDLRANDTFVDRPLNIAREPGLVRPALVGNPLSKRQAELSRGGYGLRPDPVASPALYAVWLRSARAPGRMLLAKRPDKHMHTVTTQSAPYWIGSAVQGAAPYVSIIADFHVPTAIPGAFGTTSTVASVWPGLGGFGTGSGLIQAGISIATTPTTASYSTWREYCCGDGDSNGYAGAFTPAPGDEILAEAWYCDANGQSNLNGGFGCTFLYDFQSRAVFSCTSPRGSPGGSPCWSAAALPQCVSSPRAPNCMTLGPAAEFVFENQSPQLTPPTDQFPPFAPSIVASYIAVAASGKVTTVVDDPAVTVLTDWPHNPPPVLVTLSGGDTVFEIGSAPGSDAGSVWRSNGAACSGVSCPGWIRLDDNGASVRIAAGGSHLYQLHNSGKIWRSTGAACIGEACPGWQMLDDNGDSIAIVAAGDDLYQLHRTGKIWKFNGAPCTGTACPGWQMIDDNPATVAIAAATGGLYQLHNTGRIYKYLGTPCTGTACPGWQMLDDNPATVAIAAGGNDVYQLHDSGKVWKFNGTPCTGTACPGWQMLDDNPATLGIAAASGGLYQLHNTGRIYRYVGTPCSGTACPGWQMLDDNPASIGIVADGASVYQLHNTGKVWRYTGVPCSGTACPGWQMLDDNGATGRIAAAGGQLYQIHTDRKAITRTRTCYDCR